MHRQHHSTNHQNEPAACRKSAVYTLEDFNQDEQDSTLASLDVRDSRAFEPPPQAPPENSTLDSRPLNLLFRSVDHVEGDSVAAVAGRSHRPVPKRYFPLSQG